MNGGIVSEFCEVRCGLPYPPRELISEEILAFCKQSVKLNFQFAIFSHDERPMDRFYLIFMPHDL